MHYIYIITILIFFSFFIYNSYHHATRNIKLKKEIDSLVSSKTSLLIMIESFQKQDDIYKGEISLLKTQLDRNFQELSSFKEETTSLKYAIKESNITHQKELTKAVSAARKDSVKRSRSVLRGQATEHLAPYILKDTNPKDYRFFGNPIDYICFEGLSDLIDGVSDEIKCLHFIDIKTGKSTLNKSQRRIRDAIKDSRVQFSVINLDKEIEEQNDKIKNEHSASSFKES